MFAAAQDENNNHRLSIRRIRQIHTYIKPDGTREEIIFSSRAKAKACADYLNSIGTYDKYFDAYTGGDLSYIRASMEQKTKAMHDCLSVIHYFGGIEATYIDETVISDDLVKSLQESNGTTVSKEAT